MTVPENLDKTDRKLFFYGPWIPNDPVLPKHLCEVDV